MVVFDGIPESSPDKGLNTMDEKDQTLKSSKTMSTKRSGGSTIGGISSNTHSTTSSQIEEHSKGVKLGKYIFVGFLAVVAAFLGFISFFLLARAETYLWQEQYESMTERAIETIQLVAVSTKAIQIQSSYDLPSLTLVYYDVLFLFQINRQADCNTVPASWPKLPDIHSPMPMLGPTFGSMDTGTLCTTSFRLPWEPV